MLGQDLQEGPARPADHRLAPRLQTGQELAHLGEGTPRVQVHQRRPGPLLQDQGGRACGVLAAAEADVGAPAAGQGVLDDGPGAIHPGQEAPVAGMGQEAGSGQRRHGATISGWWLSSALPS